MDFAVRSFVRDSSSVIYVPNYCTNSLVKSKSILLPAVAAHFSTFLVSSMVVSYILAIFNILSYRSRVSRICLKVAAVFELDIFL